MNIVKIGAAIQRMQSQPLEELPVGIDLPRLAKSFILFREFVSYPSDEDPEHHIPWMPKDLKLDRYEIVFLLLRALEQDMGNDAVVQDNLIDNFNQQAHKRQGTMDAFRKDVDLGNRISLTNYLKQRFGEESPVTQILKCSHQSLLLQVTSQLKTSLTQKNIKSKDDKYWKLFIKKHQGKDDSICEEAIKAGKHFTITHRRREQVYKESNEMPREHFKDNPDFYGFINCYKVKWEFELLLLHSPQSSSLIVQHVEVRLLDVEFCDASSVSQQVYTEEQKTQIRSVMEELFNHRASHSQIQEMHKARKLKHDSIMMGLPAATRNTRFFSFFAVSRCED